MCFEFSHQQRAGCHQTTSERTLLLRMRMEVTLNLTTTGLVGRWSGVAVLTEKPFRTRRGTGPSSPASFCRTRAADNSQTKTLSRIELIEGQSEIGKALLEGDLLGVEGRDSNLSTITRLMTICPITLCELNDPGPGRTEQQ